jgi:hypothetical protein
LFELRTGRRPFQAVSLIGLGVQIAHTPAPPITSYRPELPLRLEAVVLRCLEKDRSRRFADVGELAMELAEFAPKRAWASIESIAHVIQVSGLSAGTASRADRGRIVSIESAVPGACRACGKAQSLQRRPVFTCALLWTNLRNAQDA